MAEGFYWRGRIHGELNRPVFSEKHKPVSMSQVETGALSSAPTSHWGRAARKSANNEPLKARKMTVRILQKTFFSVIWEKLKQNSPYVAAGLVSRVVALPKL